MLLDEGPESSHPAPMPIGVRWNPEARLRRTRTLLFLLLVVALLSPVQAQKKLSASEAKEHYGETVTVCGDVVSARYAESSKGQPTFLNVDKPYPNQIFTIVIWGENRSKFGKPEDDYKDRRVCVTGKISAYAGSPEIVVTEPEQIAVQTTK